MLKVSIITVCFNSEDTIKRTIESVNSQTYSNLEHIIIDGASTDRTLDILESSRSAITKLISEPDSGIYNAMNKGIQAASGDLLLFLNSDDYLASDYAIEAATKAAIASYDEYDIFHGDLLIYNHSDGSASIWKPKKAGKTQLYRSSLPHPSTLFKNDALAKLKGYNEQYRIASDYELYLRALKQGLKFKKINCLISIFSRGGISTNKEEKTKLRKERKTIIKEHFSFFERAILLIVVKLKKTFGH